jgi:hypothetical protein
VSGQLHASATLPLFHQGKRPGIQWIGGWVDPKTRLDDMTKNKFLTLPGLELRFSVVQPVASHCTDCTTSTHQHIWILEKRDGVILVECIWLRLETSCERGEKPLGPIYCWEAEQLADWWLLKLVNYIRYMCKWGKFNFCLNLSIFMKVKWILTIVFKKNFHCTRNVSMQHLK